MKLETKYSFLKQIGRPIKRMEGENDSAVLV